MADEVAKSLDLAIAIIFPILDADFLQTKISFVKTQAFTSVRALLLR